jgi:hypothetical protein
MVKTIFLIVGFVALVGLGAPLRAEEMGRPGPIIFVNPTVVNTGDIISSEPVNYTLTVNNSGTALLYISKIRYT